MKTIGEIISSARLAQNLSLEEISLLTKIDLKYLDALEKNRFDLLPPPTFTKGFIRNIAKALGKSADELVAIYRRDLPLAKPIVRSAPPITSSVNHSTLVLIFTGVIIFLGYLGFQYRALLIPPPLTISQPQNKAVSTSPVVITGKTSTDSLVTIDPDIDVKPTATGDFSTSINLSPGEHRLIITATNRFSKTASKSLTITVLSSD